jgi:hypothetical protein
VVTHTPKKETGCPLLGFGLDRGIGGSEGVPGATSGWVTRLHSAWIDGLRGSEGVWGAATNEPPAPLWGVDAGRAPLGVPRMVSKMRSVTHTPKWVWPSPCCCGAAWLD